MHPAGCFGRFSNAFANLNPIRNLTMSPSIPSSSLFIPQTKAFDLPIAETRVQLVLANETTAQRGIQAIACWHVSFQAARIINVKINHRACAQVKHWTLEPKPISKHPPNASVIKREPGSCERFKSNIIITQTAIHFRNEGIFLRAHPKANLPCCSRVKR